MTEFESEFLNRLRVNTLNVLSTLQMGQNTTFVHDRQDVSSDVSSDGSGYYSVDSSGGARTFTISTSDAVDGTEINVKRNGANPVDLVTEGDATVDDKSSTPQLTLSSDNETVTLVYNSTNNDWEIY